MVGRRTTSDGVARSEGWSLERTKERCSLWAPAVTGLNFIVAKEILSVGRMLCGYIEEGVNKKTRRHCTFSVDGEKIAMAL